MTPLGELLRQRGWISSLQLEAALQRQKQLGGRLGTALLELDSISEPLLLDALAWQLKTPAAGPHDLRDLKPSIIEQLPAKLAIRAEAVPFRGTQSRLDVAMLEVNNLELHDEISFVAGKRVKVHIANESRIAEALHAYYGVDLGARFRNLLVRLNRETEAAPPEAPPTPTAAPPAPDRTAAGTRPPEPPEKQAARAAELAEAEGPRLIALSEAERAALETPTPEPVDGSETRPLEHFENRLEEASQPAEVGRLLLTELESCFDRVLLFNVRRRQVTGWLASGRGVDRRRLERFRVDLSERSIFQEMENPDQLFTGALAPLPPHLRLQAIFGGGPGLECLLHPVRVRGRLAAVIYGDNGGVVIEGPDVAHVMQLSARAGLALERCILRRKMGSKAG